MSKTKVLVFQDEPPSPQSPGSPPTPGEAASKYRKMLIDTYGLDPSVEISEDVAKALLWLHEVGAPGILSGDYSIIEQINAIAGLFVGSFDPLLKDALDLDSYTIPADWEPGLISMGQTPAKEAYRNIALYTGKNNSIDPLTISLKFDPATIPEGALVLNPKTGQTTGFEKTGNSLKLNADIGLGPNGDFVIIFPAGIQSSYSPAALNAVETTIDKFPPAATLMGLSTIEGNETIFQNIFKPIEDSVIKEAADSLNYFFSAGMTPSPVQSQLAIIGATFGTVSENVDRLKTQTYPTRYVFLMDRNTLYNALLPLFSDDKEAEQALRSDPHMFYFTVLQQLTPGKKDTDDVRQQKSAYIGLLNNAVWDAVKTTFKEKADICSEYLYSRTQPFEQVAVAAAFGLYDMPRYTEGLSNLAWRQQYNEWRAGITSVFHEFFKQLDTSTREYEKVLKEVLDDLHPGQGVEDVLEELKSRGYSWGGMTELVKEIKKKLGG